MGSLLDSLALASYSEEVLVARMAATIIRAGLPKNRSLRSLCQERVRKSLPPYGMIKTRTDALCAEVYRQSAIRLRRRQNVPLGTYHSRPSKPHITRKIAERNVSEPHSVIRISRSGGNMLFLQPRRVVIVRPRPYIGPVQTVILRLPHYVSLGEKSISKVILGMLTGPVVERAMLDSRRISLDFDRLATWVEKADGSFVEVPWSWH